MHFTFNLCASLAAQAVSCDAGKMPGRIAAAMTAELKQNLLMLQRAVAGSSDVGVDLPAGQEVRMRRIVHRGTQRPVFKVPSLKVARTVHCESLLECDTAMLFDVTPCISTFAEQPLRVRYLRSGQKCSHIPDFALLQRGTAYLVEVKFERDLCEKVLSRTAHLQALLKPLGIGYALLTERNVRQQYTVQNAHRLLRRARHDVSEVVSLQVISRLREFGRLPLVAFDWSADGSSSAVAVAQMIIAGVACVEPNCLLDDGVYVWLAEGALNLEVPAWFPAASV